MCIHETGHGVCQATAALVYMNESGALNEGFSDSWGATIENYVASPSKLWIVGEDTTRTAAGLRSMGDPQCTAVFPLPSPARWPRAWLCALPAARFI